MSVTDNNRNGSGGLPTSVMDPAGPIVEHPSTQDLNSNQEPAPKFATRADVKGVEGISKSKLILLGGGLAVAVLFFVFTAIVGKSPKKLATVKQASQSQQAKQGQATPLQRQRNAADGHPAHPSAGQHDRSTRARRHSAHPRAEWWRNQQAIRRQACRCQFSGSSALLRRHAAEVGRSGALRRRSARQRHRKRSRTV